MLQVCGNGLETSATGVGVRDAVRTQLIVEPEGVEQEYSKGAFVCPQHGRSYLAMDTHTDII